MRTVTRTIRVNKGYSNYPKTISFKVDDKIAEVLDILENGTCNNNISEDGDNTIHYYETGVMSKDSGYNLLNLKTREYGQNIGLFYCGISKGTKYLRLNFEDGGSYTYDSVLMERN